VKVEVGFEIPGWTMPDVTADRMKTVAAILRDPTPVHWDREATRALGLDGRLLNQSPVNLGYIANMLMNWAGHASIRRLRVTFPQPVFDGDRVTAGGRVESIETVDGVRLAECRVWLDRGDGVRAVDGIARVVLPT
jgi:acyl dehydratase